MTGQSSEEQNEVRETKTPKSVARIKAKLQRLHLWIEKYHRSLDLAIKIVGVAAAVVGAVFVLRQIDQITRQTKAIWYANRPVLKIAPIHPSRDIQAFTGEIERSGGTFFDSTHYSKLSFTIENVGKTPASVDKICYELATRDTIIRDTSSHGDLASLPEDRAVAPMYLLLTKGQTNIFEIRIVYNWEKPVDLDEKFTVKKYFLADYANRSWQVKILSSEQYRAEKEELCRGKGF